MGTWRQGIATTFQPSNHGNLATARDRHYISAIKSWEPGDHKGSPLHFSHQIHVDEPLASCAPDGCTKDRQAAVAGASVWSSCSNFAKRSRSGSSSTSNKGSSRRTSSSWRWASSIVIWLTTVVLIGMPVKTSYGWRIAIK